MDAHHYIPKKKLRIAVIDDNEGIYYALRGLLEAEGGHSVIYFDSPESFLDSAKPADYDCILLDYMFNGGMDGMDMLRHLAGIRSPTPVVMMTAIEKASLPHAFDMRDLGAKALLLKPFVGAELWTALRKAIALESPPTPKHGEASPVPDRIVKHPETLTKADWENLKFRAASRLSPVQRLTQAEMKIFLLVADRDLNNQEIANILFIETSTVVTHRTKVYQKLESNRVTKLRDLRDELLT